MTFKPKIWYPISAVLSVLNVASVWFAAQAAEPLHATTHAALAVGFGLWALVLKQRGDGNTLGGVEALKAVEALDALELEATALRQELSETQERLDFAERMLAPRPEPRRVDPER
jgi:hypothetical protein